MAKVKKERPAKPGFVYALSVGDTGLRHKLDGAVIAPGGREAVSKA